MYWDFWAKFITICKELVPARKISKVWKVLYKI